MCNGVGGEEGGTVWARNRTDKIAIRDSGEYRRERLMGCESSGGQR
jgi:hypothetical protein